MNKVFTFFRESSGARFFVPAGLMLIVFGVIMLIINIGNKNYIKVNAIVSKTELVEDSYIDADGNRVDSTYRVYVKYTVNDTEYEEELGELSGYKEGEHLDIYYNPENPKEITQTKSLILPIVIIGGGLAALFGGITSGVNAIKRYKKMKMQESGWKNE